MTKFVLLLPLLLLGSCRHQCPVQTIPPPVVSLTRSPTCHLRDLPAGVLPNVGFPTPDTILVSKTDYAAMIAFVQSLRDWAVDAKGCIEVQR